MRSLDAARNRVVVGTLPVISRKTALVEGVSWVAGAPPAPGMRVTVRVRYRHAGAAATLGLLRDARVRVHFEEPVRAVCPGQAAVFDQGDVVLGGGWLAAEA